MLPYNYMFWANWTTATFSFTPSFSPSSARQPRVLMCKFGDGYEQRGFDGIHADLRKWSLTFQHCPVSEADAIEAFFTTNQTAVRPFSWTPPRAGTASKFLCRSWTRTVQSPVTDTITATFEEVAEP